MLEQPDRQRQPAAVTQGADTFEAGAATADSGIQPAMKRKGRRLFRWRERLI